jgi:hypothetical protein
LIVDWFFRRCIYIYIYIYVDLRNNGIVFEELTALLGIGSSQRQFYLTMHSMTPKIQADVTKRFLLAQRDISLSSLGVVLQPDQGLSSTIPVTCKRCIRQSNTEWCTPICPATLLLLKHANTLPPLC